MKKSDKTRERLLEVGESLFSVKGYNGTGLREILAEAETPKGSFYHFFSSKEDFASQVALRHAMALAGQFERLFAESDEPPLEILRQAHLTLLERYEASGCAQTCLLARLALEAGEGGALGGQLERLVQAWLNRLTGLIASAQDRGEARKDLPASDLASLFWQSWEGSLIHMKFTRESAPVRRSLNVMIDAILAAPS